MPRGDRSGPNGLGSGTGRRAGFCSGYDMPGYRIDAVFGRGAGNGRRHGGGYRCGEGLRLGIGRRGGIAADLKPEEELSLLKAEADRTGKTMDSLNERIRILEDVVDTKDKPEE